MQIKRRCLNKRTLKLIKEKLFFTTLQMHMVTYWTFFFFLPLSRNRAHFLVKEATSSHNWPKCRSARLIRSCIILALVSLQNLDNLFKIKRVLTSIRPCNKIVFKAKHVFFNLCTKERNINLTHTSLILINNTFLIFDLFYIIYK